MASTSGTLYIGVTSNLPTRVQQHKQGTIEGFSKRYNCKKLVYYEPYVDIRDAIQREKYIKGKKRIFKQELIASMNPVWRDLSDSW